VTQKTQDATQPGKLQPLGCLKRASEVATAIKQTFGAEPPETPLLLAGCHGRASSSAVQGTHPTDPWPPVQWGQPVSGTEPLCSTEEPVPLPQGHRGQRFIAPYHTPLVSPPA